MASVLAEPDDDEYEMLYGDVTPSARQRAATSTPPDGCVLYQCGNGDTFAGISMKFEMDVR